MPSAMVIPRSSRIGVRSRRVTGSPGAATVQVEQEVGAAGDRNDRRVVGERDERLRQARKQNEFDVAPDVARDGETRPPSGECKPGVRSR